MQYFPILRKLKIKIKSRLLGKKKFLAGCWWFTSVILATKEAEIKDSKQTPISKKNPPPKKGFVE
jgi:hypothetical protein